MTNRKKSSSTGPVSRRGFALAAAAVLQPVRLAAQAQQPGDALPPADQQEVDAKLANVVRKYGDRLNEEQKTRARGVLVRHQRMLARVRAFPLDNGNTPASVLKLATGTAAERKK